MVHVSSGTKCDVTKTTDIQRDKEEDMAVDKTEILDKVAKLVSNIIQEYIIVKTKKYANTREPKSSPQNPNGK